MISIGHFDIGKHDIGSFLLKASKGRAVKSPIVVPSPIAQWECYDYTNDSEGKEVLRDLTGNGHDIQLYNFDFAEASGFGKYANNFISFSINPTTASVVKTNSKISVNQTISSSTWIAYINNVEINQMKVQITGCQDGDELIYKYFSLEDNSIKEIKLKDGIYDLPKSEINPDGGSNWCGFLIRSSKSTSITIEQIPDYKGALVSDGVDDYGLCENFPILTKEKGYTVCALRKILKPFEEIQANACLLSNYNNSETGSFYIENRTNNSWSTYSFGGITNYLDVDYNNDFVFQTSLSYNNYPINKGENTNSINRLYLFRLAGWVFSYLPSAFYAMDIYGEDITSEQIALVKERMIKRFEEKTGETYVEEVTA